jgi:adenylate kinase
MKVIIVTGTPGTGKTTLSKKLAKKLDFHYVDVDKIIKKYNISEGYDKVRKTKIIDVKKLNRALIKEINNYKKLIQSNIEKNTIKRFNIKNNEKIKFNKGYSIKNKTNQKIINDKIKNIKKGIIIDSHLSHYLPKRHVDLCIITKCNLNELENRLRNKKYPKEKIRENLDAEIFDICLNEAKENKHKIMIADTTKDINIVKISKKVRE